MTAQEFESLHAGDIVHNPSTGDFFFINQVRLPGLYVVGLADPKTLEPRRNAMFPLRSGEGLVIYKRAAEQ